MIRAIAMHHEAHNKQQNEQIKQVRKVFNRIENDKMTLISLANSNGFWFYLMIYARTVFSYLCGKIRNAKI